MNKDEKNILLNEIDDLAIKACRPMTTPDKEEYFTYQEQRRESGEALPTKYPVPIRTYYKGKNRGKVKEVFEVDGNVFEQLWNKLYNYAVKAAMSSHHAQHYNNPDVQNDVCDIRYQVFYVLRYFGARPNNVRFSQFYLLIVNNILTTSARRRGVFREVSDFTNWFDDNKFEDKYFVAHQTEMQSKTRKVLYIDWMFEKYLDKFFKKEKRAILKAFRNHEKQIEKARREHIKSGATTPFIAEPFYYSVGNCLSTMINYKSDSLHDEISGDSESSTYVIDTVEGDNTNRPDYRFDEVTCLWEDTDIAEKIKGLRKLETKVMTSCIQLYYDSIKPIDIADIADACNMSVVGTDAIVLQLIEKGLIVKNAINRDMKKIKIDNSKTQFGTVAPGLVPVLS